MIAPELFNSLAPQLGSDLCQQFVIPEVISLTEDQVFRVRKNAAQNINSICRVAGDSECSDRLVPAFVRLCGDPMYRVRRACAESLVAVSESVGEAIRVTALIPAFLGMLNDSSSEVKQIAARQSGMFISLLPSSAISTSLLSYYLATACATETSTDENEGDSEFHCAFAFPGVLLALGSARWVEVKQVPICLIHPIASILTLTLIVRL